MKVSDNKFMVTLVTINVMTLFAVGILSWMLWSDRNRGDEASAQHAVEQGGKTATAKVVDQAVTGKAASNQTDTSNTANNKTESKSLKRQAISLIEAVIKEVKAADLGEMISTPSAGNKTALKQEAATGHHSNISDREYIAAFAQLNLNEEKPQSAFVEKDIDTVQMVAKLNRASEKVVDHFNKVKADVAVNKKGRKSLAERAREVVSATSESELAKTQSSPAWKDYLKTLKVAGAERANEMRTIKVRRGDTLWKISTRAYGTGFLYRKIFEANPHLKNPGAITAGEILRVPL